MSLPTEKYGNLTVTPIMEGFGAEVSGVDFSSLPLPDELIKQMVAIQDKYGVTVYRSTGLDDDDHSKFSFQLGELELCPRFNGPEQIPRFDNVYIFDAGNTHRDGTLVHAVRDRRRWNYNKGNALWHTDSSFNQHRSKYSILVAHHLPKNGGDTGYSDVRRAYADLPQSKKDELKDLVVEHDLWHSRKVAAPEEFATMTVHELAAKQPAFHKLVQKAPDGRDTLFIAAHAKTIVGWSDEKGLALINELIDWCTQPQYCFLMKWKQPGDLVWWDNRQSMHRATPFSDQMEKRDMRRTTIFDDGPDAHGVPNPNELNRMPAA